MATKTPGKNFQAGKGMAHLFPIYHETLKRKGWEAGKGLEKVANRVVAESFENSRKAGFSQRRCANLMGLGFFKCFYYTTNFLVQNECMFLKFHENRAE